MKNNTILFVIQTANIGGAAKMIKYVANLLCDEYKHVRLLTIFDKNRSEGLDERVLSEELGIMRRGIFTWRIVAIHKIRNYIKKISPDVVCTFISDYCVLVRLATLGLSPIIVSSERGDPYTETFPWNFLVRWAYSNSDYCIFQLDKARDYYGEKIARKSFVIPNVFVQDCPVEPFQGVRNKTIVSAGRFVPEKRYEVLIQAFAHVLAQKPDYSLILYGDGPSKKDYITLCEELGIMGHVVFPGYVSSFSKAIREDGVFVLSSKYEGIPNTLVEALSVGIPCIATDCTPGGPFFLTKGGQTGLLVPVDDVNAMADAIIRVIDNENLSKELSKKGPSILSELSPMRIDNLWRSTFNTILKKHVDSSSD